MTIQVAFKFFATLQSHEIFNLKVFLHPISERKVVKCLIVLRWYFRKSLIPLWLYLAHCYELRSYVHISSIFSSFIWKPRGFRTFLMISLAMFTKKTLFGGSNLTLVVIIYFTILSSRFLFLCKGILTAIFLTHISRVFCTHLLERIKWLEDLSKNIVVKP